MYNFLYRYVQHPRYRIAWDEMWRKENVAVSRTQSIKSKASCHSDFIGYKTYDIEDSRLKLV